ncbi:hypothetical protein [Actinomadura formosensis]|uniref:hypothetical protein n=1 Tax=Actinomadura formosensis TaxID=60706 RepID=UPI000A610D4C|nr:hypothetical protein [Actinomadura formosensis]
MSVVDRFRGFGTASPAGAVDAWTWEADAVALPRLDEVDGHPRPSSFGTSYVEQEYRCLADEQEVSWPAKGEAEARRHQVSARGLDHQAAAVETLLAHQETEVREARADHQHALRVLAPYVRREPGAKLRYWICWMVLWLGDTAGVWSAAVTNGDVVYIAFGIALASGLAAACAGLVGAELKYIRMARTRQRDPESLSKDEQRYQRLFAGQDLGLPLVKLIGLLSLFIAALLAVAIYSLRAGIEGSASGLTFGLLAAATAIGSGLLSYAAADEVADQIAAHAKRVRKADKYYLKLAGSPALKIRAQADETARSIHQEHQLRGQAAGKRVESLSWRAQRRNPQVFGHGFAAGEQSGVIGRRARRNGGAA